MIQLVKQKQLELIYKKDFGSWTYHLRIPNTAHIKGKWGTMKVFGLLDQLFVKDLNLAPRKNEDKIISINKEIRDKLNKTGGQTLTATLYLIQLFDEEKTIQNKIKDLMSLKSTHGI